MGRLTDVGKGLIAAASVPLIMAAQTDFHLDNARNVYALVQKSNSSVVYQLDQSEIPAKYLELPREGQGKTGFFAFEFGGVSYLVMRETVPSSGTIPSKVTDIIDKAPIRGSTVDAVIDDAIEREGSGPKNHVDLNGVRRVGLNALYRSSVSLAYTTLGHPIPEFPRLQLPRR